MSRYTTRENAAVGNNPDNHLGADGKTSFAMVPTQSADIIHNSLYQLRHSIVHFLGLMTQPIIHFGLVMTRPNFERLTHFYARLTHFYRESVFLSFYLYFQPTFTGNLGFRFYSKKGKGGFWVAFLIG